MLSSKLMPITFCFKCHSVSTCNDELPDLPHVRLINVHIGSSFGGRIKGIRRATSTERVIGVALETNEDGILTAQEDEDGAELRFRMDKVDLTVRSKKLFDAVSCAFVRGWTGSE